jgi:2-polyprenyl-3-methyl-5-hydroxy-6-metoxy-1,4-benzoquinol methylase
MNLKKRYLDLRQGYGQFGFLLGIVNFIILTHSLTSIGETIPMWLFAIIVVSIMLFCLSIIGAMFRKKQMSTDIDQAFFRSVESCRTTRIMFDEIFDIKKAMNLPISEEAKNRKMILQQVESQDFTTNPNHEKYSEFTSLNYQEAKEYVQNSVTQPVRKRIADIVGNNSVLDVGCANGIDSHRYAPSQYFGLDISPELIRVAKERHPKHRFVCDDANNFLLTNHFDYIICKAVLEHLPDVQTMLKLYRSMVEQSNVLLLAWHMIPNKKTAVHQLVGHFGKQIYQNEYSKKLFEGGVKIKKERIENYELWTVTK